MDVNLSAEEVQILSAVGLDVTDSVWVFKVQQMFRETGGDIERTVDALLNLLFQAQSNGSGGSDSRDSGGGSSCVEEGKRGSADVTPPLSPSFPSAASLSSLDAGLADFTDMFDGLLGREDLDDIWFSACVDRVSELQDVADDAARDGGGGESGGDKHFRMAVNEALRRLQAEGVWSDDSGSEDAGAGTAGEDEGQEGVYNTLGAEPSGGWDGGNSSSSSSSVDNVGFDAGGSDADVARAWASWEEAAAAAAGWETHEQGEPLANLSLPRHPSPTAPTTITYSTPHFLIPTEDADAALARRLQAEDDRWGRGPGEGEEDEEDNGGGAHRRRAAQAAQAAQSTQQALAAVVRGGLHEAGEGASDEHIKVRRL
jgi:hypothetical protein